MCYKGSTIVLAYLLLFTCHIRSHLNILLYIYETELLKIQIIRCYTTQEVYYKLKSILNRSEAVFMKINYRKGVCSI